jgi:hypothetical protein
MLAAARTNNDDRTLMRVQKRFLMKMPLIALVLAATLASATGIALAQTHGSLASSQKATSAHMMMSADQMLIQCEQMMKDMRSDPVLMKHMNQIMQKHMMQGMTNGGTMTNGGMMSGKRPSPTPHA